MVQTIARPAHYALQNKLLAAFPADVWARIQRHLAAMQVQAGDILNESNWPLDGAYFPISSIVSLQQVTIDGATVEIAAVGSEGMVGVELVLGGDTTSNRLVVHNDGYIYRLPKEILQVESTAGGTVQRLLLQYTQRLMTQISLACVCNQRHSVEQQLARWLLQTIDRLASNDLDATHEGLANTLGVRREGITDAAQKLQCAGLILYQRGRIRVTDRLGLESRSCSCYGAMRSACESPRARYSLRHCNWDKHLRRTFALDARGWNSSPASCWPLDDERDDSSSVATPTGSQL